MVDTINSFCARLCSGTCGILVTRQGQTITEVRGDPDCQFNQGYICPKGRALPELIYHPDRLKYPLKRIGQKGEDKWQPISKNEALDTIATKLEKSVKEFGPQSTMIYAGAYRGLERDFIQRFARVLGTPNTVSVDNNCHVPRTMAARYTFGAMPFPDYEHPPQCMIIWGRNSLQTGGDGSSAQFRPAFDGGTRFIVIDPRKIALVSRSELWLKPRPGNDGLLALGMLNVIMLDFLMVADLFMTPTAALADVVLPVAANLEYDDLIQHRGCVAARPKIKAPPGECRSDMQWINLIAERMGFGQYFWQDESAALDAVLAPSGLNFDQLKTRGIFGVDQHYRKYKSRGFSTRSGKVDLFSEPLQEMGIDPLPVFTEPKLTPCGSPELTSAYPLVLTSSKNPFFYHASHRNIPSLRKLSPQPVVELHPETAAKLDLQEGDRVRIETPRGKIRQTLRLNADLDPRVVVAAFGWWFPEKDPTELYGWQEANLNLLTDNGAPHDPAMGSANLRGLICKVYKAIGGD